MTRRPTFSEIRWPDDPSGTDLPIQWAEAVTAQALDWTWRAFDALQVDHLAKVDLTLPLEQVERDLVRIHYLELLKLFRSEGDGYAAFSPVHEWPEMESRTSAAAKPPAYDLAFVASANYRWAWPLEAKVMSSPNKLGEYLKDVNNKFVGCIAAPLIGEGAMIAYLITGDTIKVFENLTARLGQDLKSFEGVPKHRPHRVSHHSRSPAPNLRLHHMVMQCSVPVSDSAS